LQIRNSQRTLRQTPVSSKTAIIHLNVLKFSEKRFANIRNFKKAFSAETPTTADQD